MTQRKAMTGAAAVLLAATLMVGASGAQAQTKMSSKHPKSSTHKKMHRSGSTTPANSTAGTTGTTHPVPAPGAVTTPNPPTR